MCRMGLRTIENLAKCTSLTALDLSHNRIDRISGLTALTQLKRLNLLDNEISTLENLNSLQSLESLQIQGNQITNIDDVTHLSELPNLMTLYFRTLLEDGTADPEETNPLCSHPAYRTCARRALPRLRCLDGEWLELVDAVEDGDQETALVVPEVKPQPWFSKQELADALAGGQVDISGAEEFEAMVTECKRASARAKTLLDDLESLKDK
eukprot:6213937-Pleurochrysis_carterae.AAC.7